jgi:pyruvate kinase
VILPRHGTKIVCTIGPSSRSPSILRGMIRAGMNVARLNFSHGEPEEHAEDAKTIRSVARELGQTVAILADLPGPKIRIGQLEREPLLLRKGEAVTLTTRDMPGRGSLIPVAYPAMTKSLSRGSHIYMNDGSIMLKVLDVAGEEVQCKVAVGGSILSHKGVNLPGAEIFMEPVSERELELIDFGLRHGIRVFGVSFVEKAEDILKVKDFAGARGIEVYTVAKIERSRAIERIDQILRVTDAVMVARGDLGVELPIEDIPVVQKKLIRKANALCKPVVTATQMLLSMTDNTRPTRAESTDVANAILDGTDGVMLSEETAIGRYPVETVRMMARIAASTERHRRDLSRQEALPAREKGARADRDLSDVISRNVLDAARALRPRLILTPTSTGATARRISRFKPAPWILSFSERPEVAEFLVFSYGVFPVVQRLEPGEDWYEAATRFLKEEKLAAPGDTAILTQGQFSPRHQTTDSMAVITIGEDCPP